MAVHGTRRRESVSWDYAGLLQFLAGLAAQRSGLPLLRCYWYEATVEGRRGADHDALADLPGVKLRLAKMRPGRREGVESEIHRDLATLARNKAVSDAMVVSAEEDLASVIADVQDLGMRVTMLHITSDGNWTISRTLRQECDDIVEISASDLRPYVDLISGAEPSGADEADSGSREAMRAATGTNGHGPAIAAGANGGLNGGSANGGGLTAGGLAAAALAAGGLMPVGVPAGALPAGGPHGPAGGPPAGPAGIPAGGRGAPSFTPSLTGPGSNGNGYEPGSRQEDPLAISHPPAPLAPPLAGEEAGWPERPAGPGRPAYGDMPHLVQDPAAMYQAPPPGMPMMPLAAPGGPSSRPDYLMPVGPIPGGRPDFPPGRPPQPPMGGQFQPSMGGQPMPPAGPPQPGGQPQLPPGQQDASGVVGGPGLPGPAEMPPGHDLYPAPVALQPPAAAPLGIPGDDRGYDISTARGYTSQDLSGYSPGAAREPATMDIMRGDPAGGTPAEPSYAQVRHLPARGPVGAIPPGGSAAGNTNPFTAVGPPPAGQSPPPQPGQPLPLPAGPGAPGGYGPGAPPSYNGMQSIPPGGPQPGGPQHNGPQPAGQGGQPGQPLLPGLPGPAAGPAPGAGPAVSGPIGLPPSLGGPVPGAPGSMPGAPVQAPGAPGPTANGLAPVGGIGPVNGLPAAPSGGSLPGGPVPGATLPGGPVPGGPVPGTALTPSFTAAQPQSAPSLADAVQSAHEEGQEFGSTVARDAPALWLEAVLARKPRMPSDLEARLLQGSSLPIDFLLHDEVRHALRRGFWDALERARR